MMKDTNDIKAFCEKLTDSEADMLLAFVRSLERKREPQQAQGTLKAARTQGADA